MSSLIKSPMLVRVDGYSFPSFEFNLNKASSLLESHAVFVYKTPGTGFMYMSMSC